MIINGVLRGRLPTMGFARQFGRLGRIAGGQGLAMWTVRVRPGGRSRLSQRRRGLRAVSGGGAKIWVRVCTHIKAQGCAGLDLAKINIRFPIGDAVYRGALDIDIARTKIYGLHFELPPLAYFQD